MKENFVNDSKSDDAENDSNNDKKKTKKKKNKKVEEEEEIELTDVEQEYLDLVETKKTLTTQLNKRPNSKVLKKAVDDCKRSIMKLVKKARNKNAKTYHKLINTDKKRANEVDYFKRKLSNKEQLRVMKELKDIKLVQLMLQNYFYLDLMLIMLLIKQLQELAILHFIWEKF